MTYGLCGDETLEMYVVSYDLCTLYLERYVYLFGRWYCFRL